MWTLSKARNSRHESRIRSLNRLRSRPEMDNIVKPTRALCFYIDSRITFSMSTGDWMAAKSLSSSFLFWYLCKSLRVRETFPFFYSKYSSHSSVLPGRHVPPYPPPQHIHTYVFCAPSNLNVFITHQPTPITIAGGKSFDAMSNLLK